MITSIIELIIERPYIIIERPFFLFPVGYALLAATGLGLLAAAAVKFFEHALNPQPLAKTRRHPFSTLGMTACVAALFPFWWFSVGRIFNLCNAVYETEILKFINGEDMLRMIAFCFGKNPRLVIFAWFAVGLLTTLAAFVWHIRAKFDIRLMWSDGIEIKRDHTLVTTGAYALARHPMYASLLLWCWGGSLMMGNIATLLITTCVILPLMIRRAKAEERELLAVHPDYALYRRNVRMLTPTLGGVPGLIVKIAMIALLGFWVYAGTFRNPAQTPMPLFVLLLLVTAHLYLGYALMPEKVAFSYRSKSGMMIVFWFAGLFWFPAFYFFWLILAMFVYGLFFNCPCMIVYEKYQGCPCWRLLRKSCKIKNQ